jgi:hypothetical protein
MNLAKAQHIMGTCLSRRSRQLNLFSYNWLRSFVKVDDHQEAGFILAQAFAGMGGSSMMVGSQAVKTNRIFSGGV